MEKKDLSERDICTKSITPGIIGSRWDYGQFREEVPLTKGHVIVRGNLAYRLKNSEVKGDPRRADYVLYGAQNVVLAVIEAKRNIFPPGHGMQQALLYAEVLDAPFAIMVHSKTKPLRVEELQPIADWWGKESDGFKERVETEQASKVDFKTLKAEAASKAKPHWDKAESLNSQANTFNSHAKDRRASMRGQVKPSERKKAEVEIAGLENQIEKLRQQAKDEQSAGDRYFWPIYNLDLKNPNAPEEESQDPDKLLAKYKQLTSEIEATQNQLRDELAKALLR